MFPLIEQSIAIAYFQRVSQVAASVAAAAQGWTQSIPPSPQLDEAVQQLVLAGVKALEAARG